jgi:hypothetical protein
MLSIGLNDEELRGAAYDLLGAVCTYLKFDKNPIVASKGGRICLVLFPLTDSAYTAAGFIPGDPGTFVVQLSERLAEFAPELTLDFMSEVSAAMALMDKTAVARRINCLRYMSPWVKNLTHFPNPTSPLYERSGARLRDCIRVLSDLSIADPEVCPLMNVSEGSVFQASYNRLLQHFKDISGLKLGNSTVSSSMSFLMN